MLRHSMGLLAGRCGHSQFDDIRHRSSRCRARKTRPLLKGQGRLYRHLKSAEPPMRLMVRHQVAHVRAEGLDIESEHDAGVLGFNGRGDSLERRAC